MDGHPVDRLGRQLFAQRPKLSLVADRVNDPDVVEIPHRFGLYPILGAAQRQLPGMFVNRGRDRGG